MKTITYDLYDERGARVYRSTYAAETEEEYQEILRILKGEAPHCRILSVEQDKRLQGFVQEP